MRITKVNVSSKAIKLKSPLIISLGKIEYAMSAVVKIETDEGIVGVGEGAPGILITGETLDGTVQCIKEIGKVILGCNPLDFEKIYFLMNSVAAHAPSAKTAIDIAIHDIIGKVSNQSIAQLFGGYRESIETDMTLSIDDADIMAKKAKQHIEAGFNTLKVKVGVDEKLDVERIKKIRESVGSAIKIRLDANQAWHPKQAIQMIERLGEYDIELVEQPVRAHNLEGLKFVRDHSRIPIMADESCFTAKDALRLVRMEAVDFVNIKLMKCGGLYEAAKISSICEIAGIECMIGCMAEETNIGVTAAAHLASGLKNITRCDLDATFGLTEVVLTGGVPLEETKDIKVSHEIGLGIGG
ncbi:dipeptide epimerase [Vagococcus fluvialis]|uniref:dipeptide epimerase n=1 Tax=Vagococcus fluvialis TaxID=2738 RepID=UPI003D146284